VVPALKKGMLCLADRFFPGYELWQKAAQTGAELLWRVRQNARLEVDQRFADGSYRSRIYRSTSDRRNRRNPITVRVIEYRLQDVPGAEPIYRLITTILEPGLAPAQELAALHHERWEIETTRDELKTHLRGAQVVLRSKTPELVRQEFYGLLMAHFAIRGLMHEAALQADEDPDNLSFLHAVRVVQRRMARYVATPPSAKRAFHEAILLEILQERVSSSRHRSNPRGVKRKMSNYPLRPRKRGHTRRINFSASVRIVK
jgi:hypothetical protein